MALATISQHLKKFNEKSFSLFYTLGFFMMLIALSLAGMMEAGFLQADINLLWTIRMLCGLFILLVTLGFFSPQLYPNKKSFDSLGLYHLAGFLSDGLGGLVFAVLCKYALSAFGISF